MLKNHAKVGFLKAKKALGIENTSEIAVVGDQIFTDVIGARRSKMYAILTKPIDKRDIFMTRIKRPLEEIVIKRYLKREERRKNKCI